MTQNKKYKSINSLNLYSSSHVILYVMWNTFGSVRISLSNVNIRSNKFSLFSHSDRKKQ